MPHFTLRTLAAAGFGTVKVAVAVNRSQGFASLNRYEGLATRFLYFILNFLLDFQG